MPRPYRAAVSQWKARNGMTEATLPLQSGSETSTGRQTTSSTFSRVIKYTIVKILVLFVTVVVGVYLAILVANMGGHVDEIRKGQIQESVTLLVAADPAFQAMDTEVRNRLVDEMIRLQEERLGLNRPFIVRSFQYLSDALTLSLGRAENLTSDSGSKQVRLIILERLPPTLLLFATANLLNFFLSVFLALSLSRKYGSLLDRLIIAFSPTSAAPGWFYGIFLILIFAAVLSVLPFGGLVDAPPPESPVAYGLSLLKHLILPVSALVLSTIFGAIYAWRTFFLIYSSEDYVEMAKAKGLSSREIERRYILRPTLPNIITTFALNLITLWQGAIILETVFNWPGLGRLFYRAIGLYDTPVIVGSTVIYAYLLAITVFLLDFVYALVDPRVKIGGGGSKA
jgi:peptide/nickel transport system permease protein